jgi:hypothetical protein
LGTVPARDSEEGFTVRCITATSLPRVRRRLPVLPQQLEVRSEFQWVADRQAAGEAGYGIQIRAGSSDCIVEKRLSSRPAGQAFLLELKRRVRARELIDSAHPTP